MSNLSRTKKYEDLRNKIHNDAEGQIQSEPLSRFANQLNKIEPNAFETMNIKAPDDNAVHARREAYFNDTFEEPIPSFHNEYLDEFIDEVKKYNIKKGLRSVEDTQLNILNDIKSRQGNSIIKESNVKDIVLPVEEPRVITDDETKKTISTQILKLMNAEEIEDTPNVESSHVDTEKNNDTYLEELENERQLRQKMMEETQQLKAQLEEYEDDLDEVNEKVSSTNKLLNLILIFLILALLVILGVATFWVLNARGMI